jgi:hypothetical protein
MTDYTTKTLQIHNLIATQHPGGVLHDFAPTTPQALLCGRDSAASALASICTRLLALLEAMGYEEPWRDSPTYEEMASEIETDLQAAGDHLWLCGDGRMAVVADDGVAAIEVEASATGLAAWRRDEIAELIATIAEIGEQPGSRTALEAMATQLNEMEEIRLEILTALDCEQIHSLDELADLAGVSLDTCDLPSWAEDVPDGAWSASADGRWALYPPCASSLATGSAALSTGTQGWTVEEID